jgi:hypothetical protein
MVCTQKQNSVVIELLRVGMAALETGSECSFTTRKLECEPSPFLTCFCLALL